MCERFAVTGYPTLVLFDKGMMHTYRGAREQPDLVDFALVPDPKAKLITLSKLVQTIRTGWGEVGGYHVIGVALVRAGPPACPSGAACVSERGRQRVRTGPTACSRG